MIKPGESTLAHMRDFAAAARKLQELSLQSHERFGEMAAAAEAGDYLGLLQLIDKSNENSSIQSIHAKVMSETLKLVRFTDPNLYDEGETVQLRSRIKRETAGYSVEQMQAALNTHLGICGKDHCMTRAMLEERLNQMKTETAQAVPEVVQ